MAEQHAARRGSGDGDLVPSPLLSLGPLRLRGTDVVIWTLAALALIATLWFSFGAPAHVNRYLGSDKVAHAIAYAVDTLLLLFAVVWRPSGSPPVVWRMAPILVAVVALGGVVEVVQGVVGRDAQILDWIADSAGVVVATAVFTVVRWRHGRRQIHGR